MKYYFIAEAKKSYEGVIRPFIEWSKGKDSLLVCYRCSKGLVKEMQKRKGIRVVSFDNKNKLSEYLKNKRGSLIFDDFYPRLKLATSLNTKLKKEVYVHVLHGVHSIFRTFEEPSSFSGRLFSKILDYIPFKLLTGSYVRMLNSCSKVTANSHTCANFLVTLYGIEPDIIDFPPIDKSVFKNKRMKRDQVMIYTGSNAGDTDIVEMERIISENKIAREKIAIFGSISGIKRKYLKGCKVISNVSDKELALEYNRSHTVYALQRWELYGYVVDEALKCGCKVVAKNYGGPWEIQNAKK